MKKQVIIAGYLLALTACFSFASGSGRQFSIATFNVKYFSAGLDRVYAQVQENLPDIIVLQEVLEFSGRNYAAELAVRLGYHAVFSSSYQQFKDGRKWLLAVLSRFPLTEREDIKIGSSRRALKVSVNLCGQMADIVTTHLSPMVWDKKNLLQANMNRSLERIKEMEMLLKRVNKKDNPVIILGDFNEMPGSNLLEMMKQNGFDDADLLANKVHSKTFRLENWTKKKIKSRKIPGFLIPEEITLDYIFYRGPLKVLRTESFNQQASDHYLLKTEFRCQNSLR